MSKKLKIILTVALVIIFSSPVLIIAYIKLFTNGSCGGFVGRVCPNGFYCKGATQYNEGSGTCTIKLIPGK